MTIEREEWSYPGGAEAYYLEHYHDIEARYQQWCRDHGRDPQDVGSMVDYEDTHI